MRCHGARNAGCIQEYGETPRSATLIGDNREELVMSKTERAKSEIERYLTDGESIVGMAFCQVKTGDALQRAAKDVAVSVTTSVLLGAFTGGYAFMATMAPQVWLVLTDRRVLMFRDPRKGRVRVGELVFDAPRELVVLTERGGAFSQIAVSDATSGETVVQLNFGLRKKDSAAIMRSHTS